MSETTAEEARRQEGYAYRRDELPPHMRWQGDGPPPAYWWVGGVKVYRSYEDYCDV